MWFGYDIRNMCGFQWGTKLHAHDKFISLLMGFLVHELLMSLRNNNYSFTFHGMDLHVHMYAYSNRQISIRILRGLHWKNNTSSKKEAL